MTTTQKDRWAARAERRVSWAEAAEAKAAALLAPRAEHARDWAWNTQPGHLPQRARELAQADRGFEMLQKAQEHREKAANLDAMASRQKGDAEAARQTLRDALAAVKPGDIVHTILYGPREVVRANSKTFSVRNSFGGTMTVDKAHCRLPA